MELLLIGCPVTIVAVLILLAGFLLYMDAFDAFDRLQHQHPENFFLKIMGAIIAAIVGFPIIAIGLILLLVGFLAALFNF